MSLTSLFQGPLFRLLGDCLSIPDSLSLSLTCRSFSPRVKAHWSQLETLNFQHQVGLTFQQFNKLMHHFCNLIILDIGVENFLFYSVASQGSTTVPAHPVSGGYSAPSPLRAFMAMLFTLLQQNVNTLQVLHWNEYYSEHDEIQEENRAPRLKMRDDEYNELMTFILQWMKQCPKLKIVWLPLQFIYGQIMCKLEHDVRLAAIPATSHCDPSSSSSSSSSSTSDLACVDAFRKSIMVFPPFAYSLRWLHRILMTFPNLIHLTVHLDMLRTEDAHVESQIYARLIQMQNQHTPEQFEAMMIEKQKQNNTTNDDMQMHEQQQQQEQSHSLDSSSDDEDSLDSDDSMTDIEHEKLHSLQHQLSSQNFFTQSSPFDYVFEYEEHLYDSNYKRFNNLFSSSLFSSLRSINISIRNRFIFNANQPHVLTLSHQNLQYLTLSCFANCDISDIELCCPSLIGLNFMPKLSLLNLPELVTIDKLMKGTRSKAVCSLPPSLVKSLGNSPKLRHLSVDTICSFGDSLPNYYHLFMNDSFYTTICSKIEAKAAALQQRSPFSTDHLYKRDGVPVFTSAFQARLLMYAISCLEYDIDTFEDLPNAMATTEFFALFPKLSSMNLSGVYCSLTDASQFFRPPPRNYCILSNYAVYRQIDNIIDKYNYAYGRRKQIAFNAQPTSTLEAQPQQVEKIQALDVEPDHNTMNLPILPSHSPFLSIIGPELPRREFSIGSLIHASCFSHLKFIYLMLCRIVDHTELRNLFLTCPSLFSLALIQNDGVNDSCFDLPFTYQHTSLRQLKLKALCSPHETTFTVQLLPKLAHHFPNLNVLDVLNLRPSPSCSLTVYQQLSHLLKQGAWPRLYELTVERFNAALEQWPYVQFYHGTHSEMMSVEEKSEHESISHDMMSQLIELESLICDRASCHPTSTSVESPSVAAFKLNYCKMGPCILHMRADSTQYKSRRKIVCDTWLTPQQLRQYHAAVTANSSSSSSVHTHATSASANLLLQLTYESRCFATYCLVHPVTSVESAYFPSNSRRS